MTVSTTAGNKRARNIALLAGSIAAIGLVYLLVPAWPQPAAYHAFADQRAILQVANFWNVVSNLAILVPGLAGLYLVTTRQAGGVDETSLPMYRVLFLGAILTSFGSAWYHLSPDNTTLVWDRLPLTIIPMSLLAAVIAEFVSPTTGRRLLYPLLSIGAFSVLYWAWSESLGAGDLRLYGIIMFWPLVLIAAIVLSSDSPFDKRRYLMHVFWLYALAKLAEFLDATIFSAGQILSGHSLKHILAGVATAALLHGLVHRRPVHHA